MKSPRPFTAGFLQAAGVVAYILLFASIAQHLQNAPDPSSSMIAILLFLLTFSFSVLVCGSLALIYPIFLVVKKKWKDALLVIVWMAVWIALALGGVATLVFSNILGAL